MADVQKAAKLLGGKTVLGRRIETGMALHEVLDRGLPREALRHFVGGRRWPAKEEVLRFVGARETGKSSLKRRQGDRLFVLAEALARAADTFGSMWRAEKWMVTPLMSPEMGGRQPLELLSTPVGEWIVAGEIHRNRK